MIKELLRRITRWARVRCLIVHNTGGSWRGRRRKETVTLWQPSRDAKMAQYWVLTASNRWCRTPSDSRQWWWQSQLSILLKFQKINQSNWLSVQVGLLLMVYNFGFGWSMPPFVYKLCSLHNLPEMPTLKPLTWLQKKTLFQFSTVLTKNCGFQFRYGYHHSTNQILLL